MHYAEQPLLDVISSRPDPYSLSSMFHTIEMAQCLVNNLSQSTDSQKEILLTGFFAILTSILGWLALSLMHFVVAESRNTLTLKPMFSVEYLEALVPSRVRHMR